jgi:hypothetical protein
LNINEQASIDIGISNLKKTGLYAPGLAFVSKVSLSTLGVVEYFHALQCSLRFSFLGFWDERVVSGTALGVPFNNRGIPT